MKRSARQQAESASSLFPFLAVLLCTMGALIVLLVTLAQVSRDQAVARAEELTADAPPEPAEVLAAKQRLEAINDRRDQIADWRRQADERLAEEKQRLADVNDHIRQMQEEAEALVAEMKELLMQEEQHYDDEKMAQAELERLREQAAMLEREIEELRDATADRERVALIPPLIDGAGTHRPPIYFECFADKVVLQPEGIEFSLTDTRAAKHSSPFAAAVDAVVRYYLKNPSAYASGEAGDPYPLIVTKPDGVLTMLEVIDAFDATGIVYGYETVPEDWDLDFGTRNPELAQLIQQAIHVARLEREALADYAPQLFKRRESGYLVNATGDGNDSATIEITSPPGGWGDGGGGTGGGESKGASAPIAEAGPTNADAASGPGGPAAQGSLLPTDAPPNATMVRIENLQATQAAAERLATAGGDKRGIALVRPIRLVLHDDYAVILADEEDPNSRPQRIDCPDGVLNHAETLIASLADHAETWGAAGAGMRWSPQVLVSSASSEARLEGPVLHLLRMFGVSAKGAPRIADTPRTAR